jgi:cytochrome c biogenesis protein CcdA
MDSGPFLVAVFSAFWVGILTSISPCPLATNIAAMSYLAKEVGKPRLAVQRGLIYAVGRSAAYIALAAIFVKSALASPRLAQSLQTIMSVLIGPLLILVALFLLEVIRLPSFALASGGERVQTWVKKAGSAGALVLGFLFALSFCPVSAGLFFGTLIPLSLQTESVFVLPFLYGVGTALPVVGFSLVIVFGAHNLSRVFNVLTHVEKWARYVTAAVFILVGLFLIWRSWPLYLQWLGGHPNS